MLESSETNQEKHVYAAFLWHINAFLYTLIASLIKGLAKCLKVK